MRLVVAWVLAASLAGCLTSDPQVSAGSSPTSPSQRPVVVAFLDTGVNPYHAAFAAPADGVPWPDAGAVPVSLSMEGEGWESRVETDHQLWQGLQPQTLYRMEGTRLMAISFGQNRQGPIALDQTGHGTHTSSIVARDAPHAILVMVQIDSRVCLNDPSCLAHPSIAQGMEWAADQPWIDVISVSLGIPGNVPDPSTIHPDVARYVAASRRAWESGKLVVTGAGNEPSATVTDYFDGPPWIVSVGGAHASAQGEATPASRGVDVAANFTALVASHQSLNAMVVDVGTSMSAPAVAATLAEAIRIGQDIPPSGIERRDALRGALNATAITFSPTRWTPSAPGATLYDVLSTSNPVILEGVQMGWGYVDASMAPQLAEAASREGPSDVAASPRAPWQERWHAAREAYWSSFSEGALRS